MHTFQCLRDRLGAIAAIRPRAILADLGKIEGHPFWRLDFPGDPALRICLASGIHGDEPAGVEAILHFIENFAFPFSLTCFPCMNPPALLAGSRCGPSGIDLNRGFGKGAERGANCLFERAVGERRWDLFIDLHEDYEAEGFYALEVGEGCASVGCSAARDLSDAGFPVERKATLRKMLEEEGGYPLLAVEDGVAFLSRTEGGGGEPQAPFMARMHAERAITFETPSRLPFEARVRMHEIALRAAIAAIFSPKVLSALPSFDPWSGRRAAR